MNQKIKISQLPAKGSNLAAADLLEIAEFTGTGYISKSITGQEIIDAIPAPSVDWGDIGGTLSDQTDLNTALSGKVPTSRTLTINGTTQDLSADRTFTISTGITIGTTAITSGTVGRVMFQGTGNVVQESANLFWDNTNGIFNVVGRINAKSTTAQPSSLIVEGTTGVNSGNAGFVVRTGTGYQATFFAADNLAGQGISGLGIFSGSATPFGLQTGAPNGAFFIHNNGNIGIGTSYTNAGFRLDVNGTARVQDNLTIVRNQNATTGIFISNTNNSSASNTAINLTSSSGEAVFAKKPALGSVYKTILGNDTYIYNGTAGDISMLNDFSSGQIKFAAGGSSTAHMTIKSNGRINMSALPTSSAGLSAGDIWNDAGTLKIV